MLVSRFGHFRLDNWAVNLEFHGDFTQVVVIEQKNGVNCERESPWNLWESAQGWQH